MNKQVHKHILVWENDVYPAEWTVCFQQGLVSDTVKKNPG